MAQHRKHIVCIQQASYACWLESSDLISVIISTSPSKVGCLLPCASPCCCWLPSCFCLWCILVPQVTDIRLITDRHTKRSKGLAYVEFSRQEEVFAALTLTGQVRTCHGTAACSTLSMECRLCVGTKCQGRTLLFSTAQPKHDMSMLQALLGAVEKVR